MSSLTALEKRIFEDLFNMGSGYVLDFSNPTFAEFFRSCVSVDIYADKYSYNGDSKAKRVRAFWETESDDLLGKVLNEMLNIWEYENLSPNSTELARLEKAKSIVKRLSGDSFGSVGNEGDFLKQDFSDFNLDKMGLDEAFLSVLKSRLNEAKACFEGDAPLSVILLTGSILEGLLLFVASQNARLFNQAKSAPKGRDAKVRKIQDWSLAQLIDVAYEVDFLKLDVKKFSHELRDFRNYIHPYQQALSCFNPTKHTAEICLQVLKAAIFELNNNQL